MKKMCCQYVSARTGLQNFDVEDAPRSGRPDEADKDTIKALVDANWRITTREIDERLNLLNSTVYDHLKGLGLSSKLDIWVPHVLAERNLCPRIDVCDSLLKRHENDPFLKRIITGDEKWVVYNNVKRKRSWRKKDEPAQRISKVNIHQKKVMLSVWWYFKGIVFFEILPDNTIINSEVYCHQLDKLNDALQQKRPELINRKGVVFHQDNARPHTSLVSRQKLLQLEWDTMLHPPYSPDLAPSDYYLFRSLQNFLDGKTFTSNEEVKNHLDQFFASKDQKFCERGIMLLPKKCYFHSFVSEIGIALFFYITSIFRYSTNYILASILYYCYSLSAALIKSVFEGIRRDLNFSCSEDGRISENRYKTLLNRLITFPEVWPNFCRSRSARFSDITPILHCSSNSSLIESVFEGIRRDILFSYSDYGRISESRHLYQSVSRIARFSDTMPTSRCCSK
ncbi:histone-lysine N-methyltransferase SETMAR-like [Vespa mandarinia]|uniref:histone-lysine N-methyltransferase SETMAR-like n=1 Tax=Vespa mandarinia TaxID=7446 RepID=UPI00160BA2BA|nr:histone-lysine N-methyltransferase SETMAR-like [Vespa mandarinia]